MMQRCLNTNCKDAAGVGYSRVDDSFCGECGSRLKADKEEDDGSCKKCQRFLVPRWKFCPKCCDKLTT